MQVPYFICIDLLFHDPVVDPFGCDALGARSISGESGLGAGGRIPPRLKYLLN